MDSFDAMLMMYAEMRLRARGLQQQVDQLAARRLRAETAGGVPAATVALLPTAANGGLSDGTAYIDLYWASNGRKPGEGAGLGTGVLVCYKAATDQWLTTFDYTVVST